MGFVFGSRRRFSTGLDFLDRRMDGGIPAGSLLALMAPPDTQAELLLARLAADRRVHLISTTCPWAAELERTFAPGGGDESGSTFEYATPEALLQRPESYLDDVSPEAFLIVDGVDPLEAADRETYLDFLNTVKGTVRERDSVAVLHGLERPTPPSNRPLSLKRADWVWRLEKTVLTHDVRTRLLVTKARGGRALSEPVPLLLTDRVQVDTTRNI